VHGNTVSVAQTHRVELQRVTGLNLKLYCVTLTDRHRIESITWHTGYCQTLSWTWHQAEKFSSHSECTIYHSTHDRNVNFGLRIIYISQ